MKTKKSVGRRGLLKNWSCEDYDRLSVVGTWSGLLSKPWCQTSTGQLWDHDAKQQDHSMLWAEYAVMPPIHTEVPKRGGHTICLCIQKGSLPGITVLLCERQVCPSAGSGLPDYWPAISTPLVIVLNGIGHSRSNRSAFDLWVLHVSCR